MLRKHWRDNYDFISWQQFGCIGTQADPAKSLCRFWIWFTNKAQAISFAEKVTKRRKNGQRAVSIYEIDENIAFSECSILRFDEPGEAWLDFVSDNRSGNYVGEAYDFIFGPVANDDVYRTFTHYTAGLLTKQQTLEQLKIKKLYNQLVLTTEQALSYLRFIGTVPEEEF